MQSPLRCQGLKTEETLPIHSHYIIPSEPILRNHLESQSVRRHWFVSSHKSLSRWITVPFIGFMQIINLKLFLNTPFSLRRICQRDISYSHSLLLLYVPILIFIHHPNPLLTSPRGILHWYEHPKSHHISTQTRLETSGSTLTAQDFSTAQPTLHATLWRQPQRESHPTPLSPRHPLSNLSYHHQLQT